MGLRWAVFSIAALCSLARTAAEIGLGWCPDQPVVENIDLDRYAGTWYEYSKYARGSQNEYLCPEYKYTLSSNNVYNIVYQYKKNNGVRSDKGQMKLADPFATEGKFSERYIERVYVGREYDTTAVNYQVLDTDYTSYSIVWDCTSVIFLHFTKLRVLTRDRKPADALLTGVYRELSDRGFKISLIDANDHDSC